MGNAAWSQGSLHGLRRKKQTFSRLQGSETPCSKGKRDRLFFLVESIILFLEWTLKAQNPRIYAWPGHARAGVRCEPSHILLVYILSGCVGVEPLELTLIHLKLLVSNHWFGQVLLVCGLWPSKELGRHDDCDNSVTSTHCPDDTMRFWGLRNAREG